MLKKVIFITLILFLPALIFSYKTLTTKNFYIHYPDNVSEDLVIKIGQYAEGSFRTLQAIYNYNPGKIHIEIYNNVDLVNAITNIVMFNKIDLYITSPLTEPSFEKSDHLKEVLIHEIAHVFDLNSTRSYSSFLRTIFGKPPIPFTTPNIFNPFWLIEGIAVFNEAYYTDGGRINDPYFDGVLRNYVINGFPSIDRATSYYTNPFFPTGSTPYYIGSFIISGISRFYYEDKNPTGIISNIHSGRFYYWVNYGLETFIEQNREKNKTNISNTEISYADFYEFLIIQETRNQQEKIEKIKTSKTTNYNPIYWSDKFNIIKNFVIYSSKIYSIVQNTRGKSSIILYDISKGKAEKIYKSYLFADYLSIDETGKYLVFGTYNKSNNTIYSNLYIYDTRKESIIETEIDRVIWASIDKLGYNIILMRNDSNGNKEIGIYNIDEKTYKKIDINQLSYYPLPYDDNSIIYFRSEQGKYNVYFYNHLLKREELITSTDYSVLNPRLFKDKIVFSSDKSGVYNIYSLDIKTKTITALTNIITLAQNPFISENKLYFITLEQNGPVICYSDANNSFSPPSISVKRINNEPYSPEKTDFKIENYSPLSYIDVYWWFPYLLVYNEKVSGGLITSWQDPLKEHNISILGLIDEDIKQPEYSLSYLFIENNSGLGLFLNSSRLIDIYKVPLNPTGTDDYMQATYRNSLYLLYSHSTISSNFRAELGGVYNYWEKVKEPDNIYYTLFTGNFYGLSGGFTINFNSYYFQNIKPTGLELKFYITKFIEPETTEGAANLNININTSFAIPESIFTIKIESKGLWGRKFPQMYYHIGGISPSQYQIPFRGYNINEFGGYFYVLGNIEYTLPIFSAFRGFTNKPFFIKELFINLFYDFGQVSKYSLSDIKLNNFDISYGTEMGFSLFFGYVAPINILVGFAKTYPKDANTIYLRMEVPLEY
ncbi:MAG TPA: hypothetical protein PKW55_07380 [Spirochaetota bacterium]|nr:hypothetical protein [Spirochaetota bacterium]HOM38598.1 hypothetical protein [Spirochaetota bacterium]HPQ49735.1 hypothetical protein [Spirochaetota bacterium]